MGLKEEGDEEEGEHDETIKDSCRRENVVKIKKIKERKRIRQSETHFVEKMEGNREMEVQRLNKDRETERR